MMISITGIGWFTAKGYGCIRSGQQQMFEEGESVSVLPKKGVFSHPFKNFGRLDGVSKSVAYAVALALQDAGIEYSPATKQSIGIVGMNREGSLRTDIDYFEDYIRSGRTLSRANLFIYTLPSSPLGESAIHFGFLGPLLYAAPGRPVLGPLLDMASEMIAGSEAETMLAGTAEEEEGCFFVLGGSRRPEAEALCGVDRAIAELESAPTIPEMVHQFSQISERKA